MMEVLHVLAKLREANISFVTSVCRSVRLQLLAPNGRIFNQILCLSIFRKSVEKVQV